MIWDILGAALAVVAGLYAWMAAGLVLDLVDWIRR